MINIIIHYKILVNNNISLWDVLLTCIYWLYWKITSMEWKSLEIELE